MYIAERLRQFREAKQLSQGEIEKRSGLLRCYVSRVENGHTIPSLETLGKMTRALEVPMYQLFYDGWQLPAIPNKFNIQAEEHGWPSSRRERNLLTRLTRYLSLMGSDDRKLLRFLAGKISAKKLRARK